MAWEWVPVENDTSDWVELDLSPLLSRVDRREIPVRVVTIRFKSSSPDCERFIHRPLDVLIEAGRTVEALRPITETWKVTTFVVNHHRTLSGSHLYARVSVSTDEETVGITLDKQP